MRPSTVSISVVVVLAIASICSDHRAVKAAISTYIEYSSILDTHGFAASLRGCNSFTPSDAAEKDVSNRTNEDVTTIDTSNDTKQINRFSRIISSGPSSKKKEEDVSSLRFRNHPNDASTTTFTQEATITIAQKDSEAINSNSTIASESGVDIADARPTGLRLVLIGDSITRYQYLSLAFFLRHGKWFDPKQKPHLVDQNSYIRKAFKDPGWAYFFRETNRLLSPMEKCDCFRERWPNIKYVDRHVMENRYFHDPERNNTLTYLQAYGNTISVLHGRISPEEALHNDWTEFAHVNSTWQWQYSDWGDALERYVTRLKATHVMMNAGMWPNDFYKNKQARDSIVRALKKTGLVGIWRGNTYLVSHEMQPSCAMADGAMTNLFGDNVLNVSWSRELQQKYFWDSKHFREPVYRVMNEELLEMVGHTFSADYEKQNVIDLQEPNATMQS
jgi:hypothetical protein